MREEISRLEHQQWLNWTHSMSEELRVIRTILSSKQKNRVPNVVGRINKLLAKWEHNWKPYNELSETTKEFDRAYANKVIAVFKDKILQHKNCKQMHIINGSECTCLDIILHELEYKQEKIGV